MVMVWIPPGKIPVPNAFIQPGVPKRPVHIDGFFIDRFCVTNRMFARFLNDYEYTLEEAKALRYEPVRSSLRFRNGCWKVPPGFGNHPVHRVPGHFAWNYTTWAGASLPNLAQWERAAGAEDGRWYPWGNKPCTMLTAYTHDIELNEAVPVWWYPQGDSPFDVRQMCGNAAEYIGDGRGGGGPPLVIFDENGGNPIGFLTDSSGNRYVIKGKEDDTIPECRRLCYCCPHEPRGFRCAIGHRELMRKAAAKVLRRPLWDGWAKYPWRDAATNVAMFTEREKFDLFFPRIHAEEKVSDVAFRYSIDLDHTTRPLRDIAYGLLMEEGLQRRFWAMEAMHSGNRSFVPFLKDMMPDAEVKAALIALQPLSIDTMTPLNTGDFESFCGVFRMFSKKVQAKVKDHLFSLKGEDVSRVRKARAFTAAIMEDKRGLEDLGCVCPSMIGKPGYEDLREWFRELLPGLSEAAMKRLQGIYTQAVARIPKPLKVFDQEIGEAGFLLEEFKIFRVPATLQKLLDKLPEASDVDGEEVFELHAKTNLEAYLAYKIKTRGFKAAFDHEYELLAPHLKDVRGMIEMLESKSEDQRTFACEMLLFRDDPKADAALFKLLDIDENAEDELAAEDTLDALLPKLNLLFDRMVRTQRVPVQKIQGFLGKLLKLMQINHRLASTCLELFEAVERTLFEIGSVHWLAVLKKLPRDFGCSDSLLERIWFFTGKDRGRLLVLVGEQCGFPEELLLLLYLDRYPGWQDILARELENEYSQMMKRTGGIPSEYGGLFFYNLVEAGLSVSASSRLGKILSRWLELEKELNPDTLKEEVGYIGALVKSDAEMKAKSIPRRPPMSNLEYEEDKRSDEELARVVTSKQDAKDSWKLKNDYGPLWELATRGGGVAEKVLAGLPAGSSLRAKGIAYLAFLNPKKALAMACTVLDHALGKPFEETSFSNWTVVASLKVLYDHHPKLGGEYVGRLLETKWPFLPDYWMALMDLKTPCKVNLPLWIDRYAQGHCSEQKRRVEQVISSFPEYAEELLVKKMASLPFDREKGLKREGNVSMLMLRVGGEKSVESLKRAVRWEKEEPDWVEVFSEDLKTLRLILSVR
jgi:hypothetical protein